MIIYKITNDINDKVYIGQTIRTLNARIRGHFSAVKLGSKSHLHNAMRKYGTEHFHFTVLATTDDKDTLDMLEKFYIQKYDSVKSGYNMSYGGETNPMDCEEILEKHNQKMRSDEVRKKISESMKLYYKNNGGFSENHKKHLSENKKQLYDSPEGDKVREKFRQSFHLSEAHYKALNDAKNKSVYCINENDEVVADFNRVKDAALWWAENGCSTNNYKSVCAKIKDSFIKDRFVCGLKWFYRV